MPIINVQLLEGRTDEQKSALIAALTQATTEAIGAPAETVRVIVLDVPKTAWGIGGKPAKALGR